MAKPDTILAWYRKLIAKKFDGFKHRRSPGRPPIEAAKHAGPQFAPSVYFTVNGPMLLRASMIKVEYSCSTRMVRKPDPFRFRKLLARQRRGSR